jgi:hypothetical protein
MSEEFPESKKTGLANANAQGNGRIFRAKPRSPTDASDRAAECEAADVHSRALILIDRC